jgi:hypothetical protein
MLKKKGKILFMTRKLRPAGTLAVYRILNNNLEVETLPRDDGYPEAFDNPALWALVSVLEIRVPRKRRLQEQVCSE